jgi:hypothetical protein
MRLPNSERWLRFERRNLARIAGTRYFIVIASPIQLSKTQQNSIIADQTNCLNRRYNKFTSVNHI